MSAQTTNQSQTVTVFSQQKINIGFGGQQTDTGVLTKSIVWNPQNYSLLKAVMTLDVSQSYLSGAKAYAYVNGTQAGPTLSWGAFATGDRNEVEDITTQINNGSNTFQVFYHLSFGAIGPESAEVSLSVVLTLQYIGPVNSNGQPTNATTNPVGNSTLPSFSGIWASIKGFFGSAESLVIWGIVAVVAGVTVYEAFNLYSKGSLDSLIGGAKKAASKVKETATATVAKASPGGEKAD